MAGFGIALGLLGVGGLVLGSVKLFNATRLSIENIRIEAALIRRRQSPPNAGASEETGRSV
jgi:hypothetical protein